MITSGDDTPNTDHVPDQHRFATMEAMPVPTARLKTLTEGHLDFHASQRWPQLEEVTISWRGGYGYVSAYLSDDEALPVCRLRYLGSDTDWGSRSTEPAPRTTTTRCSPTAAPPAPRNRPSTAPWASTSPTRPPGSNPRRTNAALH